VNTVAARASQAARASVAPDALHASALVDLLWADDEGTSLRRSIQYLQTAARLDSRPAPILADLSAAHLVRAERANSPRDLLEAVETAERALQKDPANRAALFNRALGLERFGLVGEAGRSWRAYLTVDSTSDWADAARKRLAEVSRVPVLPKAPSANATDAELAAYAVADPQGARTMGWDHLLGEWGAAVLANDGAKAADRLHRAEVLGNALERAGRDATLADAVRAIRAQAANLRAMQTLASAHRAFSDGRVKFHNADYPGATPHFAAAREVDTFSPTLGPWVDAFYAGTRAFSGYPREGEAMLRGRLAVVDARRNPALAGRLRLALAAILVRIDQYEEARNEAVAAAALLALAGEPEPEGAALGTAADATFAMGDPAAGYALFRQAIERLRPYPGALALHNVLFAVSEHSVQDGNVLAAIHTQTEGVDAATRNGLSLYVTEATLARARILMAAGHINAASRDVEKGRALVAQIHEPNARAWFETDLRLARAETTLRDMPDRATAALDSVIGFFEYAEVAVRLFPALVGRARAKVARNDIAGGTVDLERAVAMLADRRNAIGNEFQRAALVESARDVFAETATLHLKAERPAQALAIFDLGRPSLVSRRKPGKASNFRSPAGDVVISYALLRDTLFAWTLDGADLSVARTAVDTAEFARTVELVRSSLEMHAENQAVRTGLERLYDWLIHPVEQRLGSHETPLVVIPDGMLAAVPFAALYDRRNRRYLVEAHPLRFATNLREAASKRRPGRDDEAVLVVADPAFDATRYPALEALDGAATEAREVASRYPRARVLAGRAATPISLSDALRSATLVHYAGHAVFDDERPERSSLVLAPQSGGSGSSTMTAATMAEMNLGHTRLVVLSACQSIRSGTGSAGGFAGLAGALRSAGVGGVVGSLWRVDDDHTGVLMSEFYLAYRQVRDPVNALRTAQLALLRSADPALSAPAAWSGFRYMGE
jgi:CHAT domain-containing protein